MTHQNPLPHTGRSAEEDALYQVLNIEHEAQAIITEAEEQAQRMVADARERARQLKEQAERESHEEATLKAEEIKRLASQDAQNALATVKREMAAWEEHATQHLAGAVETVLAMVTMTDPGESEH